MHVERPLFLHKFQWNPSLRETYLFIDPYSAFSAVNNKSENTMSLPGNRVPLLPIMCVLQA